MSNNKEGREEDFASMLEDSFTGMSSLKPGQSVETTILAISGGSIFLELNGKSEGVLDAEELTDKEGNLTVKEGDVIKAFFTSSKNGEMRFTTKITAEKAGKGALENAYKNQIPVEGVVEKEIKGGFEIKIGQSRAFCPFSQIGLKRVENAADYIGTKHTFKIIEYGENGRNILVSSRVLLEEEKQEIIGDLRKTLKEGMVIKGTVKSIRDFGAFVDIGGVEALLPISEISRTRVNDIKEVLSVGQVVEAAVLNLDWKNERLSLSMKALIKDPWEEAVSKYPEDSIHSGEVVRIADFGAFVSLEPGLDGLVHVSDMNLDSRDNHPRDAVKKGETVRVKINSVDSQKKRISLKLVSSTEEETNFQSYSEGEGMTYNPFAALLKEKKRKK